MKIASIRDLKGLGPVLKDPGASGPSPVYWVFTEIGAGTWENITLIAPGEFNGEYSKTFGHYHGAQVPEIYHLVEGEGVLLLQKKHFEKGVWVQNQVDEVILIKAKPGDEVEITPEWGHSWSNIGKSALISYDDWRSGHSPTDYEPIENLKGMSYYLLNQNDAIKLVPNTNYENLPEPKWFSAAEFKKLNSS